MNQRLKEINPIEIFEKYPDKAISAYMRGKNWVLVLDTCKIVFTESADNFFKNNILSI